MVADGGVGAWRAARAASLASASTLGCQGPVPAGADCAGGRAVGACEGGLLGWARSRERDRCLPWPSPQSRSLSSAFEESGLDAGDALSSCPGPAALGVGEAFGTLADGGGGGGDAPPLVPPPGAGSAAGTPCASAPRGPEPAHVAARPGPAHVAARPGSSRKGSSGGLPPAGDALEAGSNASSHTGHSTSAKRPRESSYRKYCAHGCSAATSSTKAP